MHMCMYVMKIQPTCMQIHTHMGNAYLYVCDCIYLLNTYRYARAYLYVFQCNIHASYSADCWSLHAVAARLNKPPKWLITLGKRR